MARAIGRLHPASTEFFVCDIQERFRSVISGFAQITESSRRLVEAAKILSIPTIVTEQVCGLLSIPSLLCHGALIVLNFCSPNADLLI